MCATPLAISKHRYRASASSIAVVGGFGGTRVHSFIQHIPCPKCGERRPLQQFVDTPFAKALAVFGIIAGALSQLSLFGLPYWLKQLSAPAVLCLLLASIIGWGFLILGFTTLNSANKYINKLGAVRFIRWLGFVSVATLVVAGVVIFLKPRHEAATRHLQSRPTAPRGSLGLPRFIATLTDRVSVYDEQHHAICSVQSGQRIRAESVTSLGTAGMYMAVTSQADLCAGIPGASPKRRQTVRVTNPESLANVRED